MKRFLFFFTIITFYLSFSGVVFADWALQIANDEMDETWEIFLFTDETLQMAGYSLSFTFDYDASSLDWDGASYTNTPLPGMNTGLGQPAKVGNDGIYNFSSFPASLGSTVEILPSTTQIGSFSLGYSGNRTPTTGDFYWLTEQDDFRVRIGSTEYTGTELATAGHLTVMNPVPIPGAIWLFSAGFAGLTGLRQKGRKINPRD